MGVGTNIRSDIFKLKMGPYENVNFRFESMGCQLFLKII